MCAHYRVAIWQPRDRETRGGEYIYRPALDIHGCRERFDGERVLSVRRDATNSRNSVSSTSAGGASGTVNANRIGGCREGELYEEGGQTGSPYWYGKRRICPAGVVYVPWKILGELARLQPSMQMRFTRGRAFRTDESMPAPPWRTLGMTSCSPEEPLSESRGGGALGCRRVSQTHREGGDASQAIITVQLGYSWSGLSSVRLLCSSFALLPHVYFVALM